MTKEKEIESKELIVHEKVELLKLFEVKNGMSAVLKRLEEVATDFAPDTTTDKGRKLIASQAYAVSKSKTFLDDMGKELTQEWRDKTAVVNDSRTAVKTFCDDLRDKIKKPLDEYRKAEEEKVIKLKKRLEGITNIKISMHKMTNLDILKAKYKEIDSMDVENDGWGELEFQAFKAKDQVSKFLKDCIAEREQYDKEQKELDELREKEAQRKKEDEEREFREEQERKEKEALQKIEDDKIALKKEKDEEIEKEKRKKADEANRKKQEELEAKQKEQQDKIDRIEKEKKEAKEKEETAKLEKEKSDREKEQAKKDKELADQRAKDAEARLKKIEDDKKAAEEKEQLKKENEAKNERENKKVVNNLILNALKENGFSDDDGKKIVTLIVKGLIPNIKVDYSIISN